MAPNDDGASGLTTPKSSRGQCDGLSRQHFSHDGVFQFNAPDDRPLLFFHLEAKMPKKWLRRQADMGSQRDDSISTRNLMQMDHQSLSDALAGKLRRDEEMVDVSGLLQVRERGQVTMYFSHPRLVRLDPA